MLTKENKNKNSQSQGKYLDAARAYDEVIKLAPNVAEVWLNRGGMFSNSFFIQHQLNRFQLCSF